MAWPCASRSIALTATLALAAIPTASSAGPKADDLLDAPAGAPAATKKAKEAKEPAGPKVTVLDKGDLLADPSDLGKVLKKLRKKEKLDYIEHSSDRKYVKVLRGKVEGWVLAEQLEGLPPSPVPEPTTPAVASTTPAALPPAAGDGKTAATAATDQKATPAASPTPPTRPEVVAAAPPEPPKAKPPEPSEPPEPPEPSTAPPNSRLPLSGIWISVGGGVALMGSGMSATMRSGLVPELFNYQINNLPALAVQASLGYTYAYKWLRVGVDAGYRFAGATSVVVQLPERDSEPVTQQGGAMASMVLKTPRQQIPTTGHDADVSVSIGGHIGLPKRLDLSIRARAGFQLFGFLPEFNNSTPLPQESYYGPHVGAVVDFASRFIPGFAVRLNGGYIPYAVRQQNPGLRDGEQDTSNGYYFGASAAVRLLRGFDVEVAYRMLSTSTSYLPDSSPERLKYDRDPSIRGRYMTELLGDGASRSTSQQTITIGLVFLRQ